MNVYHTKIFITSFLSRKNEAIFRLILKLNVIINQIFKILPWISVGSYFVKNRSTVI